MLVYIIYFCDMYTSHKKNNPKLKDIAQRLRHSDPVAGNDLQQKRVSYRRQSEEWFKDMTIIIIRYSAVQRQTVVIVYSYLSLYLLHYK